MGFVAGDDREGGTVAGTLGETPLFTNVRYLALTGNPLDALLPCTKTLVPCSWHHFLQNKHRAQTLDQGKRNLILPTFPLGFWFKLLPRGCEITWGLYGPVLQ